MKFKVGDRVKVINCKVRGRECENLGKIFTIKSTDKNGNRFPYELYGTPEFFGDNELELVNKFTKADLKDGDKCTLKNGQVVFVDKTSKYCFENIDEQLKYFNDDVSIVKVERPVKYETLFERKEEILDETEKRYLASVIRPFKNQVQYIVKYDNPLRTEKEHLRIKLINDEEMNFPDFKKDSMYKGMKEGKKYTLKKLGL